MANLQDIPLRRIDGTLTSLEAFRGQVTLVVNVASECGLTPQYGALQKLYETYRERGLVILGFPANEFGAQEPGTNEDISTFCRVNYGVDFPMFAKIVVKGFEQHPLYQALTDALPESQGKEGNPMYQALADRGMGPHRPGDILWNFEKFLLDRAGVPVARFAPHITPDAPEILAALESELARS
jgi:glutathione peroxidase